jgi:hypothetical protein
MKNWPCEILLMLSLPVFLAGCGTAAGGAASDLGLAGAGGVVGYKVSNGDMGAAAAGAAAGYVVSKVAQSESRSTAQKAEKAGYDRAMNQAVKQQYWIMQNQQKAMPVEDERPRLVPVVIPETNINGVIQKAHVEYLRLDQ